jgi:hypothetical protein
MIGSITVCSVFDEEAESPNVVLLQCRHDEISRVMPTHLIRGFQTQYSSVSLPVSAAKSQVVDTHKSRPLLCLVSSSSMK